MQDAKEVVNTISEITDKLNEANVSYCLLEEVALWLQGVDVKVETAVFSIQWDNFSDTVQSFAHYSPEPEAATDEWDYFTFDLNGLLIEMRCYYNTVVATDHYRIKIEKDNKIFWVKALDFYLQSLDSNNQQHIAIKDYLEAIQAKNNEIAKKAWTKGTYNAWLKRFGEPKKVADGLIKNPASKLTSLSPWLGSLKNKKVINLLGSHGSKAIAMALLGASATVVDISEENGKYALEVAKAANVNLRYIVSDVLSLPPEEVTADYDIVFMELGILHYFVDLEPLFKVVTRLLKPGGRLILQDFHPVSTKLISSKGKKHKVTGDYFSKDFIKTEVAFSKYLDDHQEASYVYERKWTLGEIITTIASCGLFIKVLDEQPNIKINDKGIPKLYTIVAEKVWEE